MTGRILTLQRQARELGRLRSGYTDTSGSKPRPVRSGTWVITSHAEHYVRAAADEWGGTPEEWQPLGAGAPQWRVITETPALDAIMPPGDPLSQSYETWSRGGCARRCDGVTEQLSDRPCLCRAEHGEEWWAQPKGVVCAATTRLNLILPQMPDVSVWRLETHSHYAANEIAAHVDLIRSATRGEVAVPVRARIEQRTRVANGKTKQFPVVAIELRGVTAGQVLGGQVLGGNGATPQLTAPAAAAVESGERRALAAAPPATPTPGEKPAPTDEQRAMLIGQARDCVTMDGLQQLWHDVSAGFYLDREDPFVAAVQARKNELAAQPAAAPVGDEGGDPNAVWLQVLQTCPEAWTTEDLEKDFELFAEMSVEKATASDMRRYLDALPERVVKAAS